MSGWIQRVATQAADILMCNILDISRNRFMFKQELANS